MKKQIIILLILLSIIAVAFIFIRKTSNKQKIYTTEQAKEIIDDLYENANGFSISGNERKFIEEKGGNPTYGEITPEGLAQLIDYFKEYHLKENDVFYDLGSGVGKVCMQVALTTPAKAIGIELSATRHAIAQQAKDELIKEKILTDKNKLQFIEGNILDADLSDASVIFMCSTCFSDELMQKISDKIVQLPQVVEVISLKQLPDPKGNYMPGKTFKIPMTWSENTNVYTYERL